LKTTARELAAEINQALGAGTVRLGSDESLVVTTIPTGVLPIDYLLGGGIPKGRFTEFFGAYSTLKSYIALRAIAECQADGGTCAIVDTEHAYDPEWARRLGVDPDELIYQAPSTGEEAMDVSEVLIRNGIDLLVWDSIAATVPQTEANKRLANETVQPARLAALMSMGLRKLTAANEHTAVIFINQTRLNVGQMFGDPETVPGGRAMPFYASHRVALRRAGRVKEGQKVYDSEGKQANVTVTHGHKVRATLEKSKLTAPSKDVLFTFDLHHGEVDEVGFAITQGLIDGHVKHEGRRWWVDINGEGDDPVVGLPKFRTMLEKDQARLSQLKKALANSKSHGTQDQDSGTDD
jgi:recombination protein RecA|tara:strand:- start:2304 stop:3356 length:1053 start_codon:yes stop_codon:yes gene_type:complete